ncbi:MAG: cytochrome c3 family protein [Armatimonadetes bacterium]|nr:cytochrome c3 family protein [Armatimonadota bacterium]
MCIGLRGRVLVSVLLLGLLCATLAAWSKGLPGGPTPAFLDMKESMQDTLNASIPGPGEYGDQGPGVQVDCLKCHADKDPFIYETWRKSRHAIMNVKCNACHGTHEQGFTPKPAPERCSSCHAREVAEFQAGRHRNTAQSGTTCVSCHPIHDFDLAIARDPRICVGCHRASSHVQRYLFSKMGVIHQIRGRDSAAECQRCHVPESLMHQVTTDTRNDYVVNHDPSWSLTQDGREAMTQMCVECHAESTARSRIFQPDPIVTKWTRARGSPGN